MKKLIVIFHVIFYVVKNCFLLLPPRPKYTRTGTPLPYPTLFRSGVDQVTARRRAQPEVVQHRLDAEAARRLLSVDEADLALPVWDVRSEEHTSELQSLMRISYAVFCLQTKESRHKSTRYMDVCLN